MYVCVCVCVWLLGSLYLKGPDFKNSSRLRLRSPTLVMYMAQLVVAASQQRLKTSQKSVLDLIQNNMMVRFL